MKLFNQPVFILIHSLKYEAEPTKAKEVNREQFYRLKATKKPDQYIERVTENKYCDEWERLEREEERQEYKKAIMKKYNVPENFESNRYFMEQVRPTLF